MLVLDAHNTTSPSLVEPFVIVVFLHEFVGEALEILEVFLMDLSEGNCGGGLLVDELAEVSLSTDEAEGNTLGSAKSWQTDNQFNGVNIVGNNNELGLSFFDEVSHMVKTELDVDGLASVSLAASVGLGLKSLSLVGSGLWAVFSEHLEELGS